MTIELTKIWLDEFNERKAFRVDFSNGRHYQSEIKQPQNADQVAEALFGLAHIIKCDLNNLKGH